MKISPKLEVVLWQIPKTVSCKNPTGSTNTVTIPIDKLTPNELETICEQFINEIFKQNSVKRPDRADIG